MASEGSFVDFIIYLIDLSCFRGLHAFSNETPCRFFNSGSRPCQTKSRGITSIEEFQSKYFKQLSVKDSQNIDLRKGSEDAVVRVAGSDQCVKMAFVAVG